MSLTAANYSANLITARRQAGVAIGLAGFDGSDAATRDGLSYDQLRALNQALAQIIVNHPQSFDPARVASAAQIIATPDGPLADSSFSFSQFGDELAAQASITLPQVGKYIFYGALVLGAVYLLAQTAPKWLPLFRRAPAAA